MGPSPSGGETSTTPNPAASPFDGSALAVTVSLLLLLSKDPHGSLILSSSAAQAVLQDHDERGPWLLTPVSPQCRQGH